MRWTPSLQSRGKTVHGNNCRERPDFDGYWMTFAGLPATRPFMSLPRPENPNVIGGAFLVSQEAASKEKAPRCGASSLL
jgi:hypothetical protein